MSINKLKESWPAVQTAIDDLEAQGKVFVLRTESKGGQPKTVLYNPVAEKEDLGPNNGAMDEGASSSCLASPSSSDIVLRAEFQSMFKSLATPASHMLAKELTSAGLTATTVSSSAFNPLNPTGTGVQQTAGRRKKGARGGANRKVKLTNTHLGKEMGVDLSRDYTPDGPATPQGQAKPKGRR